VRDNQNTEIVVGDVVRSDERQMFERRDAGTLRGRLRVVRNCSCDGVTNDDQESYVRVHGEDPPDDATVDQVARGLLDGQLTGRRRRHPGPTQTRRTVEPFNDIYEIYTCI